MLCVSRRANPIALVPRDVLNVIFAMVARDFDCSPLSELPLCPQPGKQPNETLAEDNGEMGFDLFT